MINITISKNKFGKFSYVRLEIEGSVMSMTYDDYKKLITCVLNPKFTNYRGEMYLTDKDYTSELEKLRK
jgi:hypothetical protein